MKASQRYVIDRQKPDRPTFPGASFSTLTLKLEDVEAEALKLEVPPTLCSLVSASYYRPGGAYLSRFLIVPFCRCVLDNHLCDYEVAGTLEAHSLTDHTR